MPPLSLPVRRLLALGILLVVFAVPFWFVVRPVLDEFASVGAEIDEKRAMLTRYAEVASRLGAVQSRLDAIKRSDGSADDYLAGESEAIVAADLQNRLKRIIADAGGKLASTQVLPSTEEAGFRQVAVRVRLNTRIAGLRSIFYRLESGQPLLFIDNVDISSRQDRRRATEAQEDPDLTVTFDVYGYVRPEQ